MMKKIFFSLVIGSATLIVSCSGDTNSDNANNADSVAVEEQGETINFAETEKYQTLDPIQILDVGSYHVAGQIFECLVRFDEQDLSLQPSIADSWVVDENKKVFTFSLRKGVYFHDNACFEEGKGRELKSSDVLYSFKRIYSKLPGNYAYTALKGKVLGGEAFYNDAETPMGEKELKGVKIIDDYNIEITLEKPYVSFLELVASMSSAIVAKEAIENDVVVGTGPFTYNKENDSELKTVLKRNKNYYLKDKQQNQLPYLASVTFNYGQTAQEQMDLFLAGELDVVTDLPPNAVKDIVNNQIADFQDKPVKYVLGRYPLMSTSYLSLNTSKAPFDDKKVRQAFALAINKDKLVNDVLKGEAFGPANNGIVPPAINNYDYGSVIGLEHDIEKAKKLLAEAGFKDGKGFPSVTLTSSQSNNNIRIALNIQKQLLSNLNISVEIESMTLAEVIEKEKYANTDMTLSAWLAEFPDPISFLSLFNGETVPASIEEPSYINRSRYNNAAFNKLYNQAISTTDLKKKYEYCLEVDQIVATDVPAIPLWYHENFRLIQGAVKNYQPNTMNIQYLVNVKLERIAAKSEK